MTYPPFIRRQWTSACHMHFSLCCECAHPLITSFFLLLSLYHSNTFTRLSLGPPAWFHCTTANFVSFFRGLIALFSFILIWSFVLWQCSAALFCTAHSYWTFSLLLLRFNIHIKPFFCLAGSTLKRLCLGKERGSSM